MARLTSTRRGGRRKPPLARAVPAALSLALLGPALAACGAAAKGGASATRAVASYAPGPSASSAAVPAPPGQACGAAAGAVAARAAGVVARRIYELELDSVEVRADRHQIENFQPLLSALSSGSRAAVGGAVTSLVFSHTHVVRLRVTSGGTLLADVGGPYILAPVTGTLRAHGHAVGHYVFSVQDDSGYAKLEQRFVGAPLIMRSGGRKLPVEATLPQSAASLPTSGRVSYRGGSYQVLSFNVRAFPQGALAISLLIAAPSSSPRSCHAVEVAELGGIGERVWRRFVTVGAPPSAFVHSLGSLTGAFAYVRAGARLLAGSTRPGPARLPLAGTIRYRGKRYIVSSFAARSGGRAVRVYQLLPA